MDILVTAGTELGMLRNSGKSGEKGRKGRIMRRENKLGHSVDVHVKVLLGHDNCNYIGKKKKTAKCEGLLTPPPINIPPEK